MFTPEGFATRADQLVGLPYVLGAEWTAAVEAPAVPKALDCSELVEGLFRENGTPIGDLAASQYDRTRPVSGAPKIGDLVFLRNNPARWNGIGHVAVITRQLSNGDWRVIEARGRAYGVVKTTLSYWKTRDKFAGVRRFDGFALSNPTPPKASKLRVVTYNSEHPGYGGNYRYTDDGLFLRDDAGASLVLLQEADEKARNAIRKVFGPGWLTWPTGLVSVHWPRGKWDYGKHAELSFGTVAARAMRVELFRRSNGARVWAVSCHIRPGAVTNLAGKKADVRKLIKWLDGLDPVIVGGDWNTEHARPLMEAAGFTLATPWQDTLDKRGVQRFDAVYVRGLDVRGGEVLDPGPLSDHKAALGRVTLPPST